MTIVVLNSLPYKECAVYWPATKSGKMKVQLSAILVHQIWKRQEWMGENPN